MRITNTMLVNNMLNYINQNLQRMDHLQKQMASGKKITVPSDDPVTASRALRFRADVSQIEQFGRNTSDALSWVETTEDALSQITDVTQRVRELMVQASNGVLSESDTKSLGEEMNQLKVQLIQLGNSSYAGRYVFSGNKTDKKLFVDDENSEDFGFFQISVDTKGDKINYEIGVGNSMNINVTGGDLFNLGEDSVGNTFAKAIGGSVFYPLTLDGTNNSFDIDLNGEGATRVILEEGIYSSSEELIEEMQNKFDELGLLIQASIMGNQIQLKSTELLDGASIRIQNASSFIGFNEGSITYEDGAVSKKGSFIQTMDDLIEFFSNGDVEKIGASIEKMDAQLNNLLRIRADLGARYNRLELTQNRLALDEVTFTELLSLNEDADLTEVIMKLKNEENLYNASLSGGARIIQPSLLDFLR